MAILQVLNPVAQSAGKNKFLAAKRVTGLNGKKIGLYNNNKPRGDVAQRRLIDSLGARFHGLQFQRFSGNIGGRSTLTPQGAQEIAEACDVVIGIRAD